MNVGNRRVKTWLPALKALERKLVWEICWLREALTCRNSWYPHTGWKDYRSRQELVRAYESNPELNSIMTILSLKKTQNQPWIFFLITHRGSGHFPASQLSRTLRQTLRRNNIFKESTQYTHSKWLFYLSYLPIITAVHWSLIWHLLKEKKIFINYFIMKKIIINKITVEMFGVPHWISSFPEFIL